MPDVAAGKLRVENRNLVDAAVKPTASKYSTLPDVEAALFKECGPGVFEATRDPFIYRSRELLAVKVAAATARRNSSA